MKNPLTFKVESWAGSVFVALFSLFLTGFLLIAIKNFNSETDVLGSAPVKLRKITSEERLLIDKWLERSNTGISVEEVGYRYLIQKFPDRPWLIRNEF